MYVDDIVTVLRAQQQLTSTLQSAELSLRKWTFNSRENIAKLPPDHILHSEFIEREHSSIGWNGQSDVVYFSPTPLYRYVQPSKREVLSKIARLFDPAG